MSDMTEHDIQRIAEAVVEKTKSSHICVFQPEQIYMLTKFTDSLSNGGWKRFQAILDFGSSILLWRKTASVLVVTGLLTGIGTLLVLGIRYWIELIKGA